MNILNRVRQSSENVFVFGVTTFAASLIESVAGHSVAVSAACVGLTMATAYVWCSN